MDTAERMSWVSQKWSQPLWHLVQNGLPAEEKLGEVFGNKRTNFRKFFRRTFVCHSFSAYEDGVAVRSHMNGLFADFVFS